MHYEEYEYMMRMNPQKYYVNKTKHIWNVYMYICIYE